MCSRRVSGPKELERDGESSGRSWAQGSIPPNPLTRAPLSPRPVDDFLLGVMTMRSVARDPNHDTSEPGGDRQWDLAIDIASELWLYGEYVVEMDPLPAQRLVDVQWAALEAGHLLGARATIRVTETRRKPDPRVTVRVTFVDPNGRGLQRAQEGLDALLRSVQEAQSHKGRAHSIEAREVLPEVTELSSARAGGSTPTRG
jgi:hypothetical protein